MSATQKRRNLIRDMVTRQEIFTQTQLVKCLDQEGINSTQASVSRDIAALGLIKIGGRYALSVTAVASGLSKRVAMRIHDVRTAGENLVILHTSPGEANLVAIGLDAARWPFVSGTIAGDDTVFVACDGRSALKNTLAALHELVQTPFKFEEESQS